MSRITRLILVRHGESTGNSEGILCGWHDSSLTEKGIAQAERVALVLKDAGINAIISSDLQRAKQTSLIISKQLGLDVCFDERFRERACGIFDGKKIDDLKNHESWENFVNDSNFTLEGGESIVDFSKRISESCEMIAREHEVENILLISHGGVLWAMVPYVLGVSASSYNGLIGMDNCSISVFSRHDENWVLQTLNSTQHLGGAFLDAHSWRL